MRFGRALVAVVLGATISVAVLPGGAGAAPSSDGDGLKNLATCIAQNQRAAVEVVVDQSISLRGYPKHPATDPEAKRVDLARSIVTVLGQLATTDVAGKKPDISLKVVGFGSSVNPVFDWEKLDGPSAERARAAVEEFRNRDDDVDTDYVQALDTARADVLGQAQKMQPSGGAPVCHAVFWFTDGKFSINSSSNAPARPWAPGVRPTSRQRASDVEKIGRGLICNANGLADQNRQSETYIVTAALRSNDFGPKEEGLLRGVTYGGGEQCGSVPGQQFGTYFSGNDFSGLLESILPNIIGNPPPERQGKECAKPQVCSVSFELDQASSGATVLVQSKGEGQLSLSDAAGESADFSTTVVESKLDGALVKLQPVGLGFWLASVDLDGANDKAFGEWKVTLNPTSSGNLSVWVKQNLSVALRPVDEGAWTRGKEGTATFRLEGPKGRKVPADKVTLTDVVPKVVHGELIAGTGTGATATISAADATEIRVTYTPLVGNRAASAKVDVTATVEAASGRAVVASTRQVPINVPGVPSVSSAVHLGVLRAERSEQRDAEMRQVPLPVEKDGSVQVKAAPDGDGRVCLAAGQTLQLAGETVKLNSDAECVNVKAGTSTDLPLTLSLQRPKAGLAAGTLQLSSESETGKTEQFEVPIDAQVVIEPPDPFTDASRLVWLLAVAILLPAAAWVAVSVYTARFSRPSLVKAFRQDVEVRPAQAAFETPPLDESDWGFLENKGPRNVGFEGLQITAPVRLFRAQDAVVTRGSSVVHGSLGSAGRRWSKGGRIAHQLHGQWVFVTDAAGVKDGAPVRGDLYLFVVGAAVSRSGENGGLFERAHTELMAAYSSIVDRLDAAPEQVAEGVSGGPSGEDFSFFGSQKSDDKFDL